MAVNRTSKARGKILDIPTAPTSGAGSASVAFTSATVGGPAFSYTALSNPGSITGTGTTSPITVSGLTAGTSYTFTVRGTNPSGNSEYTSASNSVVPTVATSYESIATVSVGSGGASNVEFTSIPATYTHLQIRAIAQTTSGGQFTKMQFNNDTTVANYRSHILYATGSSVVSNTYTGSIFDNIPVWANNTGDTANTFSPAIIDILDYANTNKYKTTRSLDGRENNTAGVLGYMSGLWMSTSAITSIKFSGYSGNFPQYTQFALYGIKGA
jgi:hypothetical protein